MVSLFVLYLCYVILLIFPEYKWWLTVNCICLTRIKTTAKTFCLNLSDTGYNSEKKKPATVFKTTLSLKEKGEGILKHCRHRNVTGCVRAL